MRTPSEESLAAAAAEAEPLRRLQAFTRWVGAGRKLTQTGRITLADARELVGLLGTGDVIDPKISDRVFRTTSSEELRGITTVAEWAKASGLARVTSGRLVGVGRVAAARRLRGRDGRRAGGDGPPRRCRRACRGLRAGLGDGGRRLRAG